MVLFEAKYDLCSSKPKPELIRMNIAGSAFPNRCPLTQETIFCYNGSKIFTLSDGTQKILTLFSMSKGSKMKISIEHDTGFSCFEADTKVKMLTES